MIDISYIVTACSRPWHLACCLFSIRAQTHSYYEVIVTNNGQTDEQRKEVISIVSMVNDSRFRILEGSWENCYYASEDAVKLATGEYLCFPSDDSYYAPVFADKLLASDADLLICDQAYGAANHPEYFVLTAGPSVGRIDKTGFLLRRKLFKSFPNKTPGVQHSISDGEMIVECVQNGASWTRIPEVLSFHN